jgi:hypothetical protein
LYNTLKLSGLTPWWSETALTFGAVKALFKSMVGTLLPFGMVPGAPIGICDPLQPASNTVNAQTPGA